MQQLAGHLSFAGVFGGESTVEMVVVLRVVEKAVSGPFCLVLDRVILTTTISDGGAPGFFCPGKRQWLRIKLQREHNERPVTHAFIFL